MKIKEVSAKTILVKSKLPDSDFVINPYIGCSHACLYCYARFMKRFTNHPEPWGEFVDVKVNAADLLPKDSSKYKGKSILFGSVTDAYQPIEGKYKLTRSLLEGIKDFGAQIVVLTKSKLVARDIDILKQIPDCIVAISLSILDDGVAKKIEPGASPPPLRLRALKKVHDAGIKTALFISPIIPDISDWKAIINVSKDFVDEHWFENLNLYPSVRENMKEFTRPMSRKYWDKEEEAIKKFCKVKKCACQIYFYHGD